MARNNPGMRSAGMPISTAVPAPTRAAASRARNRSESAWTIREAVVAAPTPAKANCPRLICPLQPVSTTSDTAITA